MRDSVMNEKTGMGKVVNFIRAFFDYACKHPDCYRVLVVAREQRFMIMLRKREIEEADKFGNLAMESLNFMVEAIKLGAKNGTIREDLDPLQTAIFLTVASESAIQMTPEYQVLLTHRGLTMDEYLQHSINVMLRGIASRKHKNSFALGSARPNFFSFNIRLGLRFHAALSSS